MCTYEISPLHLPGLRYCIHNSKENSCFGNKRMIKYSFAYVSVLNKYSHLKLRNSACAKKNPIARWCDDAITMVRWRETNGGKEHRFITIVLSHHRHRVIATLSSHCRNIASSSSHHRAIAIASSSSNPSPSHCRTIASLVNATSRHHHRVIAPSTQTRWSMVRLWTTWPYIRIPYSLVHTEIQIILPQYYYLLLNRYLDLTFCR